MDLRLLDRSGPGQRYMTANDRFKARFRTYFHWGVIAATCIHALAFWITPAVMHLRPWLSRRVERLLLAPPLHARPAPPAAVAVAAGFPIPLPVDKSEEEIPKPPEPIEEAPVPPMSDALRDLLREGPRITPYHIAPVLKNRNEMTRVLREVFRIYGAGIDHPVRMEVWFLIDEKGVVRSTTIKETSGFPVLDSVVLGTSERRMRFTPAWARGETVPVWISLPIVFEVELPVASDTARAEPNTVSTASAVPISSL